MKILVVDDNASLARALKTFLIQEGHEAELAHSVKESFACLDRRAFDLVITDLRLPDGEGLEIISRVRGKDVDNPPEVILMTAFGSVESAVTAMQLGATDYLTKPVSMEEFSFRIQKIAELKKLDSEKLRLTRQRDSLLDAAGLSHTIEGIVGDSQVIKELKQQIVKVSPYPSTVLITGETGVGKEMVAKAVHCLSSRCDGPFIRVNCASIPETLFESELFGHEKGAFTDARQRRIGSFEAADQGTVFLDEVGEIPMSMQAKLLRVLQEKEITRLGSSNPLTIDVRIVAATNRNLEKMVVNGLFREDLLHRLSVFNIHVPPLRSRSGDFELLCHNLLQRIGEELGRPMLSISKEAVQKLSLMPWPGNVRQLKNSLERAVVMSDAAVLGLEQFFISEPALCLPNQAKSEMLFEPGELMRSDFGLVEALEQLEKKMILEALKQASGTKSRAADILKIPRTQLLYRMKRLGVDDSKL